MGTFVREGEEYLSDKINAGETPVFEKFVLSYIDGLDPQVSPPSNLTVPSAGQIVKEYSVSQKGKLNNNEVVYSLVLDSNEGDYVFNRIDLVADDGRLIATEYVADTAKLKYTGPQAGNNLTRNMVISFNGAASALNVLVEAATWQVDFTIRLRSMSEKQRESVMNIYGRSAFINDGFKCEYDGNQYILKAGKACLGGLFDELSSNLTLSTGPLPKTVWLDVYQIATHAGVLNKFEPVYNNGEDINDYVDDNGQHNLIKIALVNSQFDIVDLRENQMNDFQVWHKGNYDPSSKLARSGGQMQGAIKLDDGTRKGILSESGKRVIDDDLETRTLRIGEADHHVKVTIHGDTKDSFNVYYDGEHQSLWHEGNFNPSIVGWCVNSGVSIDLNKKYTFTGLETKSDGFCFSPDGLRLYSIGINTNYIYQYDLGIAWDISTATYSGSRSNLNNVGSDVVGLAISEDGSKLIGICGGFGVDQSMVYQFNLSVSWDISTAIYSGNSFSLYSVDAAVRDIVVASSGRKIYVIGAQNDLIIECDLAVSWDLSTATHSGKTFSIVDQQTHANSLDISKDGKNLFIVGGFSRCDVHQYYLATPWDISTAIYTGDSFLVLSQGDTSYCMRFSGNGDRVYFLNKIKTSISTYNSSFIRLNN